MNDYEKLKHLLETTVKTHRWQRINKTWRREYISIREDHSTGDQRKAGGVFRFYNLKKKVIPTIDIFTYDPKQTDQRIKSSDLFALLTHEFGHYISWKHKMRPEGYDKARIIYNLGKEFYDRLSDQEKLWVIEEEQRAWKEGVVFVKNNGFVLDKVFYARKGRALSSYYRSLGYKKLRS